MAILEKRSKGRFKLWLFKGTKEAEGPHEQEGHHQQHAWWQVMCLTGVDYFSTLGYQPGIAFLAAGYLSPVATLILVLLTLFGALPIYGRVADESPYVPRLLEHRITVTLALITVLGAIFLKGFKEAIGVAVALVGAYLTLNVVVIGRGLFEIATHPSAFPAWKQALWAMPNVHGNPMLAVGVALLLFPKLALGLSGFETGVAVMPLVKGDRGNGHADLEGRIRNTRKLLLT